jgi:hypothetical protein
MADGGRALIARSGCAVQPPAATAQRHRTSGVELASLGQGCVVRDITPIVQAAQALGLPEMFDMTLQAVVTTVMAPVT